MQIRLPAFDELALRWVEVEPILRRATRYNGGRAEPIDLLQMTMRRECCLWLIEEGRLLGVCVTRVVTYPRRRELLIDHIAGRGLVEWWPLFVETMDDAARKLGCAAVMAFGRPGWVRFWKARGIAVHVASEIMVRNLQSAA